MRRAHFPDFLFLLETKNSSTCVLNLQQSLGYENIHLVDPEGLSGGLALLWKSSYEVEVLLSDKRIIDVKVKLGSLEFYISFVYGDPSRHLRQSVWDSLTAFGSNRAEPWMVIGDLNELVDNSEKLGGPLRDEASFFPFRNMINDCRLRQIPSTGCRYSWGGERNKEWIQCCLDRALGNIEWYQLFPRVNGKFMERIGSDHRPLFVRFTNENLSRKGRFMFDKRWTSKPETLDIVKNGWQLDESEGGRGVMDRIASCRRALSMWKRGFVSNSLTRIKQLKDCIEEEGVKLCPDLRLMKTWKWELEEAYRKEETYWKERSKENWLKQGDQNTKFFHGSVQRKRVQNKIFSIFDEDGVEKFEEGSKGDIAVQYFQKLFTSSNPSNAADLLEGLVPRVTPTMNRELVKPITAEEIKRAAFSIKGSSAPGADGMNGVFFQTYWSIVGDQVIKDVKRFFEDNSFPQDWNFTQLVLLPKVQNPSKMTELRPISLCSVLYKIVSKVLCARLKMFLPDIVSEAQGAFVSGRLISDNILIAHEMVHALRTNPNCNEDFMAIKTDMSKAYDRVEWDFLEELFTRLGFDKRWITWIMFSVSFSVLLNGNAYGYITPTRGIRQGDPLSPFIFILCAEALVHVMNKAEEEKRITGLRLKKKCPSVQHLLFADDSLFMCKATFVEAQEIIWCLKLYGDASGQEINFQKSSITFGEKMEPNMRHLLGVFMGIPKEGGAGKYLGLPECFSGSKREVLAYITDKLKARLSGWYAKSLSLGGKEVLLKSVAMALPIFAMSCFRLTKDQCKKITSAMSSFWWNSCEDKNKMHWVAWDKMCRTKKEGGIGFRDLGNFNQALLAKQAWRLLVTPESLISRIYKSRYYAKKSFFDAGSSNRPSYAWRSILFGRELLMKGLMKSIGNGNDTNVWCDKWVFDEVPRRPINLEPLMDLNLKVATLIGHDGEWRMERLRTLFPARDVVRISSFPPNREYQDAFVWAYTKDGNYSVKSGNWLASQPLFQGLAITAEDQATNVLKTRVWSLKTLPKIQMFLWRALSGALAVAKCLTEHGLQTDLSCKLCRSAQESIDHVLFHCIPARATWDSSNIPLPGSGFSNSFKDNFALLLSVMENVTIDEKLRLSIPWLLWGLWKHRNVFVFEGKHGDINSLISTAMEETEMFMYQQEQVSLERKLTQQLLSPFDRRWRRPGTCMVKCNMYASWSNSSAMCGGAWILRNHTGEVLFHARDAFTPVISRMAAELRCMLWVLRSLRDLNVENCEIWSDLSTAVDAVHNRGRWPLFRTLLDQIHHLLQDGQSYKVCVSTTQANSIARDIANSVTRDGRFLSYLSIGGPSWLLDKLREENRW